MAEGTHEQPVVSYLTLRRVVGLLGVALPIVVATWGFVLCGCGELLDSISDYYGARTRDVFVGILFTIAWFLFTYRGYERKDDVAGNLACVCALGVALFPNTGEVWERTLHFLSAMGLFLVLAFFSIVLFRKSSGSPTPRKIVRNRVYLVCGTVILCCIALVGLYSWLLEDTALSAHKPVFWLESLALWAFGVSWAVKGEALFGDRCQTRPM